MLALLSPHETLLVVGCGFVVGGASGVFGVGGSFLLVPILHVVLGIPIEVAVGSTACQVLGPSTAALLARRITRPQLRLPLIITGGIIMGVLLGTMILSWASQFGEIRINGRNVAASEMLVLSTYLVLLVGIGSFSLYEVRRQLNGHSIRRGWLASLSVPPVDTFPELGVGTLSIPVLSLFGFVTGVTAGMLGISGALLLIPGLVYLLDIRSKKAILASLVVVWITSFLATISHAWNGNVDLALTLALMFGGTIGARIGSDLSNRLQGRSLRSGIGWLSLFAATLVLFQLWHVLK
ncbi:MAG: sulfite exporter TauE/SafE family protein [Planctomycetota bacterium]|nr:sulfite exporter TauE/SafE family protein [Planctomycetota bacterium]MDA1162034.1 sulfite exporter TauE/SafE family protein [Planctomycetota bacterium]